MLDAPDRIAAITVASILEGGLEQGLASRMTRMSAEFHNRIFHRGPLRNFEPKILMGEALSLYGPRTTRDLIRIKNIRNECAHSITEPSLDEGNLSALV